MQHYIQYSISVFLQFPVSYFIFHDPLLTLPYKLPQGFGRITEVFVLLTASGFKTVSPRRVRHKAPEDSDANHIKKGFIALKNQICFAEVSAGGSIKKCNSLYQ